MNISESSHQGQAATVLVITPVKASGAMNKARNGDFYKRIRADFLLQSARYLQVSIKDSQLDSFNGQVSMGYSMQ